jgi:tetratricopeptide (TPR) repeat protein
LQGQALWQLGQTETAFASLQQAVQKEKKDNSDNFLALAHFYLEQDELNTAKKYVDQALQETSTWPLCLLSHAVVLWLTGETEAALPKLAQAQRRERGIMRMKDLQYKYFWREKAVTAVEAMLTVQQEQTQA